ncbi:4-hydroxythreonine-4-phosphate dehydrogenase PdxA [Ruegeria arenilitoris]|uniref:4-hydroxythreonine-4-phosphate dehydrogenase PdxA n=1 Tax=Ruegeria arenilitoris TaxID=1173585 RepID=UPI00147BAD56|nr:4-hydroxythreonine-4-phosphate dehydrogenase PdxA [Ruegeria arenilitoris]
MIRPIALSCGEPAGIGPEIVAKAWGELKDSCPFIYIGDADHLPEGAPFVRLDNIADAKQVSSHAVPVLQMNFPAPNVLGHPNPTNAPRVVEAIQRGVELVQSGSASALCTAPINKQVLIDGAGFSYPGHTEFLAALGSRDRVVMMLTSDQLRVVPATIHIPLSQVSNALTPDVLFDTIEITAKGLQSQFGIPNPRIAVTGLNPHAGEGGKMGTEELDWIAPLLAELAPGDYSVSGPHPADTMFHAAARAKYDAAIAMYHDQALIPIKTLDFDRGVNVTLGLPFIRTSPDHGTALDIAGKGVANPTSLIEALRLAQKMSQTQ